MNIPIIIPKKPSKLTCQIILTIAATSVENDKTESNSASEPEATKLP